MRCVICRQSFDFCDGQTAVVLHHVAYGHDFVHPGACAAAALGSIFPEPGGAEFPESRAGHSGAIGYAPPVELEDTSELVEVAA
jgi:hypothetical protein